MGDSSDPEAGAVQGQTSQYQRFQNDDTNSCVLSSTRSQTPTPENDGRSSQCASIIFNGCCLLWSVAVLGVLVNSVLQENIFSILYLGIIFVFVATLRLNVCLSITFKILCGLSLVVVLAGKVTFQVHVCYETAVILKHISCDKLPVFGAECLQHNYAPGFKLSCPLHTLQKDIVWDFIAIFLSLAGAILFCCKFNVIKEWTNRVKKCKYVALGFKRIVLKKYHDKVEPFRTLKDDLNRLFEDGNEQNIFNYFRDVPESEETDDDTNEQQVDLDLGKERSTRTSYRLFYIQYITTLLRTLHALSGINLSVNGLEESTDISVEDNNMVCIAIELERDGADIALETLPNACKSEHSHPTRHPLEDGDTLEKETNVDDVEGNAEEDEGPKVAGRNAEEDEGPKAAGRNAKAEEGPKVAGRNDEKGKGPKMAGRNAGEDEGTRVGGRNAENQSKTDNSKRLTWSEVCFCVASVWPIICYILMIVHTTLEGSLLSLVYPFMVFFWGLLTSGRWHIWFWIAVTLYTLALMILKNVFKWSVISWNTAFSPDPLHAPRIIGLEKSSEFFYLTVHPVILLVALFIQCCIFKFYGTWDTPQKKRDRGKNKQPTQKTDAAAESESYGSTEPDVYWCALLCDIICFLGLITFSCLEGQAMVNPEEVSLGRTVVNSLFDSSNIPGETGNLITYVETQSVPWLYVTVSVVYFIGIIFERILYIKELRAWKIRFHIFLVIVLHLAIFFFFPWWIQRKFNQSRLSQAWYFVRCMAFALPAYQIKNGYPSHDHVHSFTKYYNFVNKYIFLCYMAVPFLMETRTLLGWMCTKTCLSKGQWFQCEDIYSSLYIVKYDDLKDKVSKPNPPTAATLTVSLGGYQPIFQTSATAGRSILQVNDADLETLTHSFGSRTEAGKFLKDQKAEDMSLITFDGVSLSNWGISIHSLKNLHDDLLNAAFKGAFEFVVDVRFKRQSDDQHFDDLKTSFAVDLRQPSYAETWNSFRDSLNSSSNSSEVVVREVFPRFLQLGRYDEVKPESKLFGDQSGIKYSNLSLSYYTDSISDASWWELDEILMGSSLFRYDYYEPNGNIRMVHKVNFITFNDRIVTISMLSMLKTFGIIALYTGVIWAIGRLIRGVFTENHSTLMFSQLDSVDPLLYLVDVLYNRIQHEDLKNQRRLYKLLTSLYADQKRMRAFTKNQ